MSSFRNGHACLEQRVDPSSLGFLKNNRGFTHPNCVSLRMRGVTTKDAGSLLRHTQDVLWGGSRQKPTSLYLQVRAVETRLLPKTSQRCDFPKSFSGQSLPEGKPWMVQVTFDGGFQVSV